MIRHMSHKGNMNIYVLKIQMHEICKPQNVFKALHMNLVLLSAAVITTLCYCPQLLSPPCAIVRSCYHQYPVLLSAAAITFTRDHNRSFMSTDRYSCLLFFFFWGGETIETRIKDAFHLQIVVKHRECTLQLPAYFSYIGMSAAQQVDE